MKLFFEIQAEAILSYSPHKKSGKAKLQLFENSDLNQQNIHTFRNISALEKYLINRADIDIWAIQVKDPKNNSQTIFKRKNVWDEMETYASKQALYQEISRDKGSVFAICNITLTSTIPQKIFVIDQSGWFSTRFTEYHSEPEFQAALAIKEKHDSFYKKIFWGIMSGLVLLSGRYVGNRFLNSIHTVTGNENDSNNFFELTNPVQNNYWDWMTPILNQNLNIPCWAGLMLSAVGASASTNSLPLALASIPCLPLDLAITFPPVIELSNLDGTNGFKIYGEKAGDYFGYSVSHVGDVNKDGFDDVIVGADHADSNEKYSAGSSYIIFGYNGTWPSVFNLAALNGTAGFKANGEGSFGYSGHSVSYAGDINGDDIDDLIIGAHYIGAFYTGAIYVIFGKTEPWNTTLELSALNEETGFKIDGIYATQTGGSVSAAGDVNGDGIGDIIMGAIGVDRSVDGVPTTDVGASYIIFGKEEVWNESIGLNILDGITGVKILGEEEADNSGTSVSTAGDINGDGIDDLIIGAPKANPHGKDNAGSSYVIFGKNGLWDSLIDLSNLHSTTGFKINGETGGDYSGWSVAAGDINGDGIGDLIIGAPRASSNGNGNAGSSYVIFGHNETWPNPFELSTINGVNGFKINGEAEKDWFGLSVRCAGDINNDGIDDLIIGAPHIAYSGCTVGSTYVIFGKTGLWNSPIALSTLNGTNGFKINGEAAGGCSGYSVSRAGDINGDGLDDLIIGAPYADPYGKDGAGASYVIFSGKNYTKPTFSSNSNFPYVTLFASLGSVVTIMVVFVIAYRHYKRKQQNQQNRLDQYQLDQLESVIEMKHQKYRWPNVPNKREQQNQLESVIEMQYQRYHWPSVPKSAPLSKGEPDDIQSEDIEISREVFTMPGSNMLASAPPSYEDAVDNQSHADFSIFSIPSIDGQKTKGEKFNWDETDFDAKLIKTARKIELESKYMCPIYARPMYDAVYIKAQGGDDLLAVSDEAARAWFVKRKQTMCPIRRVPIEAVFIATDLRQIIMDEINARLSLLEAPRPKMF